MLCLPGELRNQIYVYALGGGSKNIADKKKVTRHGNNDNRAALLRVSHQIHFEAKKMLYSCNTFFGMDDDALHTTWPIPLYWKNLSHFQYQMRAYEWYLASNVRGPRDKVRYELERIYA